jgi:hypothetical protein
MIDLNQMVERFVDEAVWMCRNEGGQEDARVITFLNDRDEKREIRQSEVLKWLRSYGVLQGLNDADRNAVPRVIVEFADARSPILSELSEPEIIDKFNDLHGRCASRVRANKNGTPRALTSLTSKALWCCYPKAIPLFDSYAQRALWIISRLLDMDREPAKDKYKRFLSVWLNLYRRVEHTISDDLLDGYPYKVRVFDRILWIIGEPDYGVNKRQSASAL